MGLFDLIMNDNQPALKKILNVILYITIGITGVVGVTWFFFSSAATLELVINGADMTTWEKDPYIECLEWLIASVYLLGIYSLLSLLILRRKKELTYAGVTVVSVSTVVSILYAFCVTYIQFPPDYEYMCYQPNFPSGDFSIFLKYAAQPAIVGTICFTLFWIFRYRMNKNG